MKLFEKVEMSRGGSGSGVPTSIGSRYLAADSEAVRCKAGGLRMR